MFQPPGTATTTGGGPVEMSPLKTVQRLVKFPLKLNKVSIYFYKGGGKKEREILKENYLLSMFIDSVLKDYHLGESCLKTEGGCSRFAASPCPAAHPAPAGSGEGQGRVMESRGRC